MVVMEPFFAEGRWWLPGHRDDAAPGSFTLRDGDASLTVYEPLVSADEVSGSAAGWTHVIYPVVHGRTNAGEDMTLFEARGIVLSPWRSDSKSALDVAAGARGRHLDADAFAAVSFQFDYLPAWLNPPMLIDEPEFGTLTVDLGRKILAEAPAREARVQIRTEMTGSWTPNVSLEQTTSVLVESSQPVSYKEALDRYVRPFQDLITLCLDRRVCLVSLLGSAPGDGDRDRDALLFFASATGLTPAREPSLSDIVGMGSGTVLWGGDAPIGMPELIERWFGLYDDCRPMLVPLLGRHYAPFMYAEHELGSTVNAAEALHRRRFDSRQLSKPCHQRRVRSVVDAATDAGVEPDDLEWAESVLKVANSKPLKQMMTELLVASGGVGEAILAVEPDFCTNVVRLRVAVAHGNANGRAELSHAQRFRHDQALRWVVRCFLVGELLGDQGEAQRRTLDKESFKFAVRRLADPEGTN